jgi:hypothetical protein
VGPWGLVLTSGIAHTHGFHVHAIAGTLHQQFRWQGQEALSGRAARLTGMAAGRGRARQHATVPSLPAHRDTARRFWRFLTAPPVP